jgi:hypothetical protein
VRSAEEVIRFISDASEIASGIAVDHGGESDDLSCTWCFDVQLRPPSLASGLSTPTESLFFCLEIRFPCATNEVRRSRKFTIYDPVVGEEIYPGGEMVVRSTPKASGGCDARLGFFFHVGNATNPGWGVFADRRNKKAQRTIATVSAFLEHQGQEVEITFDDTWVSGYQTNI